MTLPEKMLMTLAAFLLVGASAPSITVTADASGKLVTPDMRALPLHIGGRVKTAPRSSSPIAGGKAYFHQWPGVYFEAAFKSEMVIASFDDAANEYRLYVDNRAPIAIKQPGQADYRISGLGRGAHKIRLEKVTESSGHVGAFAGFYIPKDRREAKPRPRFRQIEYIGDSDMTGYGIRLLRHQCSQEEVRLNSDTQAAYPAIVAKHFGADYQINAVAGRGMVRNYGGMLPGATVPAHYPFALIDKTDRHSDPHWQPQIIVVALGSNDFSTAVTPGEKWSTPAALITDYFDEYRRFVSTLGRNNPKANLLIIWSDTVGLTDPADLAQLNRHRAEMERSLQSSAKRQIQFVKIPDIGADVSACDYHWSGDDHAKVAKWLIGYLNAQDRLWPGRR